MKLTQRSERCRSLTVYFLVTSVYLTECAYAAAEYDTDNCRRKISEDSKNIFELSSPYKKCFEANITYDFSTSELVDPSKTLHQLQTNLSQWEVFKRAPKCWSVLQPLLCATYKPKYHDGLIELPSQEMCKVARSHCRLVVERVMMKWPDFLRCEDQNRFPSNCKNTEIREMVFGNGTCIDPMIHVNASTSYYEGFEGCGIRCQDPMFTNDEHTNMSKHISCGSFFLFIVSIFIICTYCLDWKSSRGLPSEIIFYVILCFAVANLGWLLQFWPNAKNDIVCRPDGTIQRSELDQNFFCLAVFSMVYFGSLTAMCWLAVFAYVWNLTCNAVGIIRARVENQAAYFHCLIWILSAFLTILSISLGKVDGNSMSGVCFIGYKNPIARIGLVVVPLFLSSVVTFFYLTKGLYRLHVVQRSADLIPASGRKHIRAVFRRAVFFISVAVIIMLCFLATEIYQMLMWPLSVQSLGEFITCKMRTTGDMDDCRMTNSPSLGLIGLNIFLFYAGGFLVCSWAFTRATIDTWKRKLAGCFGSSETKNHRQRVLKHRLVAQAYEKKKRLNIPRNGSLSLTLQSIHRDPIGLNRLLDPIQLCQESNSRMNQTDEGEEVSSDWVGKLPHLLERRNALTIQESSNNSVSDGGQPTTDNGRKRPSHDSNSDLDNHKKRSRLSKLKQKLGGRNGFGRKGRRGSITSFESSEMGSKQYQSSNSELDKPNPKSNSGLTQVKDKLGRRNGIGWRGRFGSLSSLESNGTATPLPKIQSKKKNLLKTRVVKESCIQTSLELLPLGSAATTIPIYRMMDKGMQTSIQSLFSKDFGTQTRKSATKKQKKQRSNENETGNDETEALMGKNPSNQDVDPVLQLLTPG